MCFFSRKIALYVWCSGSCCCSCCCSDRDCFVCNDKSVEDLSVVVLVDDATVEDVVVVEVFIDVVVIVEVVVEDDVDELIKELFKSFILDAMNGGNTVNEEDIFCLCCCCCCLNAKEEFCDMTRLDEADVADNEDDDEDSNDMGDHKNMFIFLNNFLVCLGNDKNDKLVLLDSNDVLLEAFNFPPLTDDDDWFNMDDLNEEVEEMLLEFKE